MINYGRFDSKISFVYLDRCKVTKNNDNIKIIKHDGDLELPVAKFNVIILGHGTSITYSAIRLITAYNCTIIWGNDACPKYYAYGVAVERNVKNLLHQVQLFSDINSRTEVARKMFNYRFPKEPEIEDITIAQLRGKEGMRVRSCYIENARKYDIEWKRRNFDPNNFENTDNINKALTIAHQMLYSICLAAIIVSGFSPSIGFVHSGNSLSFVYDIADLYKTDITIPLSFLSVRSYQENQSENLDKIVRKNCRLWFKNNTLTSRVIPDIKNILGLKK